MSVKQLYLNSIPAQFNTLPFQIPPTNPVVQPYKTFTSGTITIPANTTFLNLNFTLSGTNIALNKVVVSLKLLDGVDYSLALPFGISSWVANTPPATDIIVSLWNSSGIDKDVTIKFVVFS